MIEKPFRNIEQKEKCEEKMELIIGDKFWSLLMQKLGAKRDKAIDNFGLIKIVFNSSDPYLEKIKHRIIQREGGDKNIEKILLGYYSLNERAIKFNSSMKEFGNDLVPCVIHELVHYAQDLLGKYPEMEQSEIETAVKKMELDWEKEAYKIMNDPKIIEIFNSDCSLNDFEDWEKYKTGTND